MVLGAFASAVVSMPWTILVYALLGALLLRQAGRLLKQLWWRPRQLERALRAQGLGGTSSRFLTGDLKDYVRMNKEAESRTLPLRCHDTAAHVAPFAHNTTREHGKLSFSWFGSIPKLSITDPDLARDVLSNKFGHFEKPQFPALSKLFAEGVASHEVGKWVKHRRILNPAFHLEKLKCSEFLSFFKLVNDLSTYCHG